MNFRTFCCNNISCRDWHAELVIHVSVSLRMSGACAYLVTLITQYIPHGLRQQWYACACSVSIV